MKKQIFIKPLNQLIELNESIIEIVFDDPTIYRNISFDFLNYVIYSIDNEEKDLVKDMLRITDLFHFELNNKKVINTLYRQLCNELTEEDKKELIFIEYRLLNFLDSIASHSNYEINYNEEINLSGLFSLFQVSLKEVDHQNYLEFLLTYIKVNIILNNFTIIVTNELTNILSQNEKKLLMEELSLMEVHLIDLKLNNNKTSVKYLIDNDWCVI